MFSLKDTYTGVLDKLPLEKGKMGDHIIEDHITLDHKGKAITNSKNKPISIPVFRKLWAKGKEEGKRLREIRRVQTHKALENNFGSGYLKGESENDSPYVDLWSHDALTDQSTLPEGGVPK